MISVETVGLSGCSALDRFKLPYSPPPPKSMDPIHRCSIQGLAYNKSLVCLCFYRGLSCANIPLYKTKGFIGFGSDVVKVSVLF